MGSASCSVGAVIETTAWDSIRPLFRELGLDPIRVENVVNPGHPDLDYTHGNIELKYMERFPARPGTKVTVPELTGEQVAWITRRTRKGGLAWLLVRVGAEWFLWAGKDVWAVRQGLTQAEWRERASLILAQPISRESRDRLKDMLTGKLRAGQ